MTLSDLRHSSSAARIGPLDTCVFIERYEGTFDIAVCLGAMRLGAVFLSTPS